MWRGAGPGGTSPVRACPREVPGAVRAADTEGRTEAAGGWAGGGERVWGDEAVPGAMEGVCAGRGEGT